MDPSLVTVMVQRSRIITFLIHLLLVVLLELQLVLLALRIVILELQLLVIGLLLQLPPLRL